MLRFENPVNGRFYYIIEQSDMFHQYCLIIYRGGTKFACHSVCRRHGYESLEEKENALKKLIARRMSRGYILVHHGDSRG
jgi:hypothetical protein